MSTLPRAAGVRDPGFLASARSTSGVDFTGDGAARAWLHGARRRQRASVSLVPFEHLQGWTFEAGSGDLVHDSGRFFRVQGLRGTSDFPMPIAVQQPIINQPEVGVLGILARRFDGVLHFLMQAKMEPGNVGLVQLSPTLQATRSNYTQVHGGSKPRYLHFFLDRTYGRVLVDQLQSEQGLFFLRKRNRNIIVETDADVPVDDDFRWMTLGQIKQLLTEEHNVNMDTRTVIAAIPLVSSRAEAEASGHMTRRDPGSFDEALVASTLAVETGFQSMNAVLSWLTGIRSKAVIDGQACALDAIEGWHRTEREIRRDDGQYFTIVGAAVEADAREVRRWTQPMVRPVARGIAAFVTRRIDGLLHFLVQARMEIGVWNLIELGPTVQYLPGAPDTAGATVPFMLPEVLEGASAATRHRSTQSEEGGRFYQYVTENIVVELDDRSPLSVPPNYTWVTLGQLNTLIQYGNHLNIEARSVLACLGVQAA
jgi:oxidase EvaA